MVSHSVETRQPLLVDVFWLKRQCQLFLTEEVNVYIETSSTGVTNPDVSICSAA